MPADTVALEIISLIWRPALEILILAVGIYYAANFIRGCECIPSAHASENDGKYFKIRSICHAARQERATIFDEVHSRPSHDVGQIVAVVSHSDRRQPETEVKMAVQSHLTELSEKHRNLERRIEEELARPIADPMRLGTLKRQKLKLKDEIVRLISRTQH